jgi:hypothetical protein
VTVVIAPPMLAAQENAWLGLLEIFARLPAGWCLVGGQLCDSDSPAAHRCRTRTATMRGRWPRSQRGYAPMTSTAASASRAPAGSAVRTDPSDLLGGG